MNKNRSRDALPILAIISLLFLLSGGGCRGEEHIAPTATQTAYSLEAEQAFRAIVSQSPNPVTDIYLNSGITMEKAKPASPDKTTLNSVTFAVFNHTDEPVIFADQGFGLMLYRYDNSEGRWEEASLPTIPDPSLKILPPKTETWNLRIMNIWDVAADDLQRIPYKRLRLFVHGTGEVTLNRYGAYLDITNPPYPGD